MPAVYPSSIKSWTIKQDRVDVVEAGDVDDLQDELAAVQTILGTNPHISPTYGTFSTLGGRMEAADAILNRIANYFTVGGQLTVDQIAGLGDILSTLTDGVNNAATITALNGAISSVTSAANSEATTRANADTALGTTLTSLTGTVGANYTALNAAIAAEVTARAAAITTESTTRSGADTAAAARLAVLEARFKQYEMSYCRTGFSDYGSSSAYQNLYLPNQTYLTSDYGLTKNGHAPVGFVGTLTRFYTDFVDTDDIFAITCTVTWQGTGGSSNNGVRGLRLQTAGGSTLAEFIKNANQDPNDEALSVSWVGRLSHGSNYFIFPQVLQNSGGPLRLRGHTPSTPTYLNHVRIPG